MCECTPTIRTPFCGRRGCEWPTKAPHPPAYLSESSALIPVIDTAMGELAVLFGYLSHNIRIQYRLGNCLDELSKIREELSRE